MADKHFAVPADLMKLLHGLLVSKPEVQAFLALGQCEEIKEDDDGTDTETPETE